MYAKEIGGHIADTTEWALWVTQRLQNGETLEQLNQKWIERDYQWIIKENFYGCFLDCCLGGSVIGFDFGSESEGTKNPETKDYRCAVPLIVVEGEEKTQSNKEEKSITIEITYTNGEKEQVHNVKKYSLEDIYMNNGSCSRQFGFEFLPYVNEKKLFW